MIICRGTNETDRHLFTSLFRDKLSLQGARIQEEKATLERVTGNARGITQQNCMQFGLMAQNEDSAAQAHPDLRVVTSIT